MSTKFHKSNSEVEYIPRHRICWYYTKRIPLSFHSFEANCSVFLSKNPTIPPLITSFVLQITIGAFLKRLANLSFSSFFSYMIQQRLPHLHYRAKWKGESSTEANPNFQWTHPFSEEMSSITFWGDTTHSYKRGADTFSGFSLPQFPQLAIFPRIW